MNTRLPERTHRVLMAAAGILNVITVSPIAAQNYVSREFTFSPWVDYATRPYHELRSAYEGWIDYAPYAPDGPTFMIAPGTYRDAGVYDKPCTLSKDTIRFGNDPNDPVIGVTTPIETTFTVVTWNVRLFGHSLGAFNPAVYFADHGRAPRIRNYPFTPANQPPDIVGYQEFWHEDDFFGVFCLNPGAIWGQLGCFGGFQNDPDSFPDALHSGLLFMSPHMIHDPHQEYYNDETGGAEVASSKGWIEGWIEKNGLYIYVFNTHAQAYDGPSEKGARACQLRQLAARIQEVRQQNPFVVVIAMGDYNVPEGSEEWSFRFNDTDSTFAVTRAKDVSAHWGPYAQEVRDGNGHYSNDPAVNDLAAFFDPGSAGARLDYVVAWDSYDGRIRTETLHSTGLHPTAQPSLCRFGNAPCGNLLACGPDANTCTNELSDHHPIVATIRIFQMPDDGHSASGTNQTPCPMPP